MGQQGNTYVVEAGDSFSRIASKVYGTGRMMQALWEYNGGVWDLQPGDVLRLPSMPKNVVVTDAWIAQANARPENEQYQMDFSKKGEELFQSAQTGGMSNEQFLDALKTTYNEFYEQRTPLKSEFLQSHIMSAGGSQTGQAYTPIDPFSDPKSQATFDSRYVPDDPIASANANPAGTQYANRPYQYRSRTSPQQQPSAPSQFQDYRVQLGAFQIGDTGFIDQYSAGGPSTLKEYERMRDAARAAGIPVAQYIQQQRQGAQASSAAPSRTTGVGPASPGNYMSLQELEMMWTNPRPIPLSQQTPQYVQQALTNQMRAIELGEDGARFIPHVIASNTALQAYNNLLAESGQLLPGETGATKAEATQFMESRGYIYDPSTNRYYYAGINNNPSGTYTEAAQQGAIDWFTYSPYYTGEHDLQPLVAPEDIYNNGNYYSPTGRVTGSGNPGLLVTNMEDG